MGTIHYKGATGGERSRNTDIRLQKTDPTIRDYTTPIIPSIIINACNTTQHQVPIPRRTQIPISLDDVRLH